MRDLWAGRNLGGSCERDRLDGQPARREALPSLCEQVVAEEDAHRASFTQRRKGGKDAKKNSEMNLRPLNFAIYSLLLCVFAPFASLREITFR